MRVYISILLIFASSLLTAQEVGDTIVVTADKHAELIDEGNVVTTVPTGAHLVVERTNEESFWVTNRSKFLSGWIAKADVVPVEQAIDFFTRQIREDLTSRSFRCRGIAYSQRGDYEHAVADYSEAIRLNPKHADAWNFRANAYRELGQYDKALADNNQAIQLASTWVGAYLSRGITWEKKGEFQNALADYGKVLEIDPDNAHGHNNRAWIWATCPSEQYRDGDKAVAAATRACELTQWREHYALNTLGAAYAEQGDFVKAIESEKQARELYSDQEKERWNFLLELYESGRPYHREPGME